jgi:hypothetical protein
LVILGSDGQCRRPDWLLAHFVPSAGVATRARQRGWTAVADAKAAKAAAETERNKVAAEAARLGTVARLKAAARGRGRESNLP